MASNGDSLQLDFIRSQFADLREQTNSLKEQLTHDTSSLSAQMRSLTASINNNSTEVLVRLTAIEAWQSSHERLDEAAMEAVKIQNTARKVEIEEMAVQMGQTMGRVEADLAKLKEADQQVKGAGAMWKWIGVIGGALILLANAAHFFGGK